MNRKIIHFDLDAFYCAVEEHRDPALCGTPFAVGGRPEERGVVASCSYAARRLGVHSAMAMSRALKLCPDLCVVPSRHEAYRETSRQVMMRLNELTPLVEQLSIDEAFLDLSHRVEPMETLAREIQGRINRELSLPCSIGAAANKLVAKIANNIGKSSGAASSLPPNAIKVVPHGCEAAFLAPLPVKELWGVGPKTEERLAGMGIRTIGELATWPESRLVARFGKFGRDLALHARGVDDRPIETEHETKSVSQETTFTRDLGDGAILRKVLRELSEKVGRSLRAEGLSGTTIKIKMRWTDFSTITRQVTLDHPTKLDREIYESALRLFDRNWPKGRRVRLLGVGVSGFETPTAYQLKLWESDPDRIRRLQARLDELRKKDDGMPQYRETYRD